MRKNILLLLIWIVCGFTYVHAHDSLWNIKTSDYHDAYYGTAVGNGGIGILPWKEPIHTCEGNWQDSLPYRVILFKTNR